MSGCKLCCGYQGRVKVGAGITSSYAPCPNGCETPIVEMARLKAEARDAAKAEAKRLEYETRLRAEGAAEWRAAAIGVDARFSDAGVQKAADEVRRLQDVEVMYKTQIANLTRLHAEAVHYQLRLSRDLERAERMLEESTTRNLDLAQISAAKEREACAKLARKLAEALLGCHNMLKALLNSPVGALGFACLEYSTEALAAYDAAKLKEESK